LTRRDRYFKTRAMSFDELIAPVMEDDARCKLLVILDCCASMASQVNMADWQEFQRNPRQINVLSACGDSIRTINCGFTFTQGLLCALRNVLRGQCSPFIPDIYVQMREFLRRNQPPGQPTPMVEELTWDEPIELRPLR